MTALPLSLTRKALLLAAGCAWAMPVAAQPADAKAQASAFVQSYAAAVGKGGAIARWINPICVQVTGLSNDQAAAVEARIETVAKSVGVKTQQAQPASCSYAVIRVVFTKDPQGVLDDAFKTRSTEMGDSSSGTQSVRTITLPIQAWYLTNGTDIAANDMGDLKALADYRPDGWASLKSSVVYQYGAGQPTPSSNIGLDNGQGYSGGYFGGGGPLYSGPSGPNVTDRSRQFLNVFVIVDAKRIPTAKLGPVGDYVAMLALSQPKAPGECQASPSITDLFASCPGRAIPEGLTSADMAYLRALYGADHTIWAVGRPAVAADVAKAMAPRLADAQTAAR